MTTNNGQMMPDLIPRIRTVGLKESDRNLFGTQAATNIQCCRQRTSPPEWQGRKVST